MGINMTPYSDEDMEMQETVDQKKEDESRLVIKLKEGNVYQLRFIGKLAYAPQHNLFKAEHLFIEGEFFPKVVCCLKQKSKEEQIRAMKAGKGVVELQNCPLCMYVDLLRQGVDEDSRQLAKEISARDRWLWYAIVKDKDGVSVKCISMGVALKKKILEVFSQWGNFTSLENGYDLYVKVTPQKGSSVLEYTVTPATGISKTAEGKSIKGISFTGVSKEELALCSDLPAIEKLMYIKTEDEIWDGLDLSDLVSSIGKTIEYPSKSNQDKSPVMDVTEASAGDIQPKTVIQPVLPPQPKMVTNTIQPKVDVNQPKCFGNAKLYDPDDAENCGVCAWKEACEKEVNK